MKKNYFYFKVIICICLYFGFCFMKKEDRVIGAYDSHDIRQMILDEFKPDDLYEIPVFHIFKDML